MSRKKEDIIWTTATGDMVELRYMALSHLYNCLGYIHRQGVPAVNRQFDLAEWTVIFHKEIARRKKGG